jgi:negative regulator of sigma E activity
VFSDGLASVSVFVETQVISSPAAATTDANGAARTPSSPPQPASATPNEVAQFGSTSAFSTVVEGRKITAVGEVPPETVRAIANSLQSVGLPATPAQTQPAPAFTPSDPRQPAPSMSLQGAPRR